MHEYRKPVLRVFVMMLPLWMSVGMAAGAQPPDAPAEPPSPAQTAHVGELVGEGPFAQFIVKYRAGSDPLRDRTEARARIQSTAQRSASGAGAVEATWLRRLGVDADVFRLAQPLDRVEAERLMQAFAADPQVEYIEVDGVMTIQRPTMGIR